MAQTFVTIMALGRASNKNVARQVSFLHKMCQSRFYSSAKGPTNMGFIGLGNMGAYMASNLMNKGVSLNVFDISKEASAAVGKKGGKVCDSIASVASSGAECIVTMLPNNKIVLEAYCGKDGIISNAKSGSMLVDSSTVDPSVAKEICEKAKAKGLVFVDAPVSGGVIGARDATLTFMVGGEKQHYESSVPFLQPMAARVVHCGPIGAGLIAKICNNMLLAISMIGVAECMNLGIRLGLDPKVLLSVVNSSTGRCWSSEKYNPVPGLVENVPPSDNYKGGFSSALITKDLGIASSVATDSQTPIPLGGMAHQIYTTMCAKGLGDKDFAVIYDFFQKNSLIK